MLLSILLMISGVINIILFAALHYMADELHWYKRRFIRLAKEKEGKL